MRYIEAPHVGAPSAIQVGDGVGVLWCMPPGPEGLGLAGLPRQTQDLDEQQRSAHNRPSAAPVALGMLAVCLEVQPGPRAHPHRAVLRVRDGELSGGVGQVAGASQANLWPCRRGRPVRGWVVGSA
jgi:hypothetical protein